MFTVMKKDTLNGYISAKVHKHMTPQNLNGTRSPSQVLSMKTQEQVLEACLLPFIRLTFSSIFL